MKIPVIAFALVLTCLSVEARRVWPVPSVSTSCTVCDSTDVVDWGDGTFRSVILVQGAGYNPGLPVRITWSDSTGPLWTFEVAPYPDGTFATLWTDVPHGTYAVTISQPHNRNRWTELAETEVTVF